MSAKLLAFQGMGVNSAGVSYIQMGDNGKVNTFNCEMELSAINDPEHMLIGIIFGAQQSMITRRVVQGTLIQRVAR